jgi:hypothetical protein
MTKKKWKPHLHSDEATMQAPKYWPGDQVQDASDPDEIAVVEFSRHDGQVCLRWPSGRKEWLHEDVLQFAPGFAPTRRR